MIFLLINLNRSSFGFQETELFSTDGLENSLLVIPEKNLILVGHFNQNSITIFDVSSGEKIILNLNENDENDGDARVQLAYSEVSNEIFASSYVSSLVSVIDPSDFTIKDQIDLGKFESVSTLAINKVTNKIYASSQDSSSLFVIDANTKTVIGKIHIGSHDSHNGDLPVNVPAEISVNSFTNQIFVTNFFEKTIAVIDGSNNMIIQTYYPDDYPTAVKSNDLTNELYVFGSNSILKLNLDDWSPIYHRKEMGVNYNANVSIDPKPNLIYLSDTSHALTIVNGTTGKVEDFVNVIFPNHCVYVDPEIKKVYLCAEGAIHSIDILNFDSKSKRRLNAPLKQSRMEIYRNFIICNDGLDKFVKYDGTPVCVKPETKLKLIERGWVGVVNSITIPGTDSAIKYQITGGKISSIEGHSHQASGIGQITKTSLFLALDMTNSGEVTVFLPRDVLDSKFGDSDDDFLVVLDQMETGYTEQKEEYYRSVSFSVPAGTKSVEIIGFFFYNDKFSDYPR